MKSRIPAMAHKEFLHIIRDWRSLVMAFVMPMVMLLLFGWAITFDIRDVKLAVHDADRSAASRELVDRFVGNGYFRLVGETDAPGDLRAWLHDGRTQMALSIPPGYERDLARGVKTNVQILIDGADANTATLAGLYPLLIVADTNVDAAASFMAERGVPVSTAPPIEWRPRFWFNPELRSQNFLVPGLIATIMMVMTGLLTSLTLVRERERGSLEQLISTPVRRHEIVIGKLIPYFVIGVIDSLLTAVVGVIVFDVPFVGSARLFTAASCVFAAAGLGIGLFISAASSSQLMAMQLAILTTMLPSFLLSGFMFAIKNMPEWVQAVTLVVPARYFLVVLRGIFLKGSGWEQLWPQIALLAALAVVMLAAATRRFKKRLD